MFPLWVTNPIASLLRQFCDQQGNAAWIGVGSLDGLGGSPANRLWRHGGHYQPMAGLALPDGFVWRPHTSGDPPELWLAPDKLSYRAIYERFAQQYLGTPGLAGVNVQIDHVFPKQAAMLGNLAYVRMLAIPPDSNMQAGATLERAMKDRNLAHGPRGKRTRLASYFSIGKATGFVGYESIPDSNTALNHAVAGALLAHLRAFGLPADVLTELDTKLTAVTAGRLR